MKKIGVILSGCGVMDGSEIHEAVLTLLAIDKAGAAAVCMAPNIPQQEVVDHLTNETAKGEKRNILVEAARIARGRIKDIAAVSASDVDAVVLPGGYGAAKNLCDFATAADRCKVHPDVARLIQEVHKQGKPVGAICIAPAILASLFGKAQASLTIGTDKETAAKLEKMGAKHKPCSVREFAVDEKLKLVTTPAYMLAERISEAQEGIEKLVKKVVELAAEKVTAN